MVLTKGSFTTTGSLLLVVHQYVSETASMTTAIKGLEDSVSSGAADNEDDDVDKLR